MFCNTRQFYSSLIFAFPTTLLENSQTIKDMLVNKHLQQILKTIDNHENGEKELDSAMQLPLFAEFANECLKLVDDRLEETATQKAWSIVLSVFIIMQTLYNEPLYPGPYVGFFQQGGSKACPVCQEKSRIYKE